MDWLSPNTKTRNESPESSQKRRLPTSPKSSGSPMSKTARVTEEGKNCLQSKKQEFSESRIALRATPRALNKLKSRSKLPKNKKGLNLRSIPFLCQRT